MPLSRIRDPGLVSHGPPGCHVPNPGTLIGSAELTREDLETREISLSPNQNHRLKQISFPTVLQLLGDKADMARVLLGVTGSVAAVRTEELAHALLSRGHELKVVPTEHSLYFFRVESLHHLGGGICVYRDADEWPGDAYTRDDPVLHIELRKWADALLIAPLDAQTLAKLAVGLSDNLLTCVYRAWDFSRPVILAPAMNTLMWESPVTLRHLRQILLDRARSPVPDVFTLDEATEVFRRCRAGHHLISPQEKRLACGDVGTGGMAEVDDIVSALDGLPIVAREAE